MPIIPADMVATQEAISDILSGFLTDYDRLNGRFDELLDKVYVRYQFGDLDASELRSMLSKCPDVEMRTHNKFLHLEPIKKDILPFVTLQSSDNWIHFRIYALLTTLDKDCKLQSLGIRFETDEGDVEGSPGSHDFCHAQLCNNINKHVGCLSSSWIPESQPSIPLDADNQISLVLCMLTSLYGGAHVRKKLNTDRDLKEHLNNVRALRHQ